MFKMLLTSVLNYYNAKKVNGVSRGSYMVYGYIYKIVNNKTNKVYIGQTVANPEKRWKDHIKQLKSGTHHSSHLQNSFNKHGNIFSFHVLNYATSREALDKLEIDYIAKYKSTNGKFGYNMIEGGMGVRHTPEMKKHKSILLTKNNPMKNPKIAKKASISRSKNGVFKGKKNPRYKHDMPDGFYLNFLYWDLLLTTGEIAELYDEKSKFINNRLKSYDAVPKSESLRNTKGLCRLSRFNSMFKEVTDEPVIIDDYPGVRKLSKSGRWEVSFYVNKKHRIFGSFLLKEDAVAECKRLRKLYEAEDSKSRPKGKKSENYREDIPDNSYLTFLYLDLLLNTPEIAKIYDAHSSTINRRLKNNGTVIKSQILRSITGLCRLSRFNSMFKEVTDEPVIIKDYPGVCKLSKLGRWEVAFSINKKKKKFGSFLLKEDAIQECKRLRKLYGLNEYKPLKVKNPDGKNNQKYRNNLPDESYLTFLYLDLLLNTTDIAKIYNTTSKRINRRLKNNNTVIKSQMLRAMTGLCRLSRFNSMFKEVTDEPLIIEDYPGVHKSNITGRWYIEFIIDKKRHTFGSYLLKEDAVEECKKLRKKYGAPPTKKHSIETRKVNSKAHHKMGVFGFTGTNYSKQHSATGKCWRCRIVYNNHRTHLGMFNDPLSAEIIYKIVWNEIYSVQLANNIK